MERRFNLRACNVEPEITTTSQESVKHDRKILKQGNETNSLPEQNKKRTPNHAIKRSRSPPNLHSQKTSQIPNSPTSIKDDEFFYCCYFPVLKPSVHNSAVSPRHAIHYSAASGKESNNQHDKREQSPLRYPEACQH